MSDINTINIKVPRQDLDKSSHFDISAAAVDAWVEQLPMANLSHTTRQLYSALSELNKVRIPPGKRMAVLEKLLRPIYFVSKNLSKHYLNKPIVLPEQSRKVADLAQAIHSQLATAYTIVATHTAALGKKADVNQPAQLIAQALHRATTNHTLNIQHHFQLYEPVKQGVWYNLHQFYKLACQHNILNTEVIDEEFGSCTLQSSYIRALLLGCCNPNQLRQDDFSGIFTPLIHWAELCQLQPAGADNLFILDTSHDSAPVYQGLFKGEISSSCLGLDTQSLIKELQALQQKTEPTSLRANGDGYSVSLDLIRHLIVSWGSISKRTFMRLEATDTLEICIGLSATHHYLSGELNFDALMEERGARTFSMQHENPFLKSQTNLYRQKDVWDSPYETNQRQTQISLESIDFYMRDNEKPHEQLTKKYRSYNVRTINASAHGYRIEWPNETDAQIKTGEIIGVKEAQSHNWSIGVIRWVSRNDQTINLGLELISPSAAPYGARLINKTGSNSEYMRVLVLPEVSITKQPVTVITPKVPFKAGLKVTLNQRGKEVVVTLTKKVNKTGAYHQFEFRRIGSINKNNDTETSTEHKDDFDSLWDNL
ncbi:MAG: hypothetical protein WCY88_14045 [Spongiibacteraceae bacterium]